MTPVRDSELYSLGVLALEPAWLERNESETKPGSATKGVPISHQSSVTKEARIRNHGSATKRERIGNYKSVTKMEQLSNQGTATKTGKDQQPSQSKVDGGPYAPQTQSHNTCDPSSQMQPQTPIQRRGCFEAAKFRC